MSRFDLLGASDIAIVWFANSIGLCKTGHLDDSIRVSKFIKQNLLLMLKIFEKRHQNRANRSGITVKESDKLDN